MPSDRFLCGIVEGFYGIPWSFNARRAYADYLAHLGLNAYIYCPKADPFLRKRWQEHWPPAEWGQLLDLAQTYRQRGLSWGVGLSPFELYRDYGRQQRRQLQAKLERLAEFEAPLLAILFDDMPGDLEDLAARQADIVRDVVSWTGDTRVLVCPTYYSFDPVLEKHFGAMPHQYWQHLGRELPREAGIFWTGNAVCSPTVTTGDIEAITRLLERPVILWDNYPVNDGAERSNFLYCQPPSGRDPALGSMLEGHLCNPMNQAILSLPAVAGLASLYQTGRCQESWLAEVLGAETWSQLQCDGESFMVEGLRGLDEQQRELLARRYEQFPGLAAREVAGWLRGEYTFDPACLTD
jgi:hyaluronoglucosaminidase